MKKYKNQFLFKNYYVFKIMNNSYIDLAKREFNKDNFKLSKIYYQFNIFYNSNNIFLSYYNISIILLIQKEYNHALDYIKNSINLNPNWYKSWRLLGEILYNLKKYEYALIAFKRSGEIGIFSDDLNDKIIKAENKIISLADTEDTEDTEDIQESDEINDNNTNTNQYSDFKNIFFSEKIQKILEDDNLKNKILSNSTNPMVMFQDKEIMKLMNEFYKEYKKK